MRQNALKRLSNEKSVLLDEWKHSKGQERLKLLVRLMDIDDELSEAKPVKNNFSSEDNVTSPLFQKRRRFKHLWLD